MKILLLLTGKTKQSEITGLCNEYFNRVKRYIPFEDKVIPDLKNTRNLKEVEIKQREGRNILSAIDNNDYVILLDENGKSYSSVQFAHQLQKVMNRNMKRIVFVVGGAYGFSKEVYDRSNERISLSSMTFSHQIIRAIFAEQLYRAFTILNNEPYHHQ